jgi:hypothetical protein
MGLRPHDLLDIRQLAKHLHVEVIPATCPIDWPDSGAVP